MSGEDDAYAVARNVADRFAAAGVPYAVGGAIALGYWGPARGTQDADFNVFQGVEGVPLALDCLEQAGVAIDREAALKAVSDGGYARGWAGHVPVDIFFNSIPLHDSAATRVVTKLLLGRPANVLSAEDLTVLKLLFNRTKDIADIERLLVLRGADFDRSYVRRWLVDFVGEDDVRVETWDSLCAQLPANAVRDS
jgi:hypothetical protein